MTAGSLLAHNHPMALKDEITGMFTYHAPTAAQVVNYEAIRAKAMELAHVIVDNSPICPDQTVAIRKLRECVMSANAAIAIPATKP